MIMFHLIEGFGTAATAVAGVNDEGRIESLRPPAPLPAEVVRMWVRRPQTVLRLR